MEANGLKGNHQILQILLEIELEGNWQL